MLIHPRGGPSPTHHRCDAIAGDGRIDSTSFSGQASPGDSRAIIVSVVVTSRVVTTVEPAGAVVDWRLRFTQLSARGEPVLRTSAANSFPRSSRLTIDASVGCASVGSTTAVTGADAAGRSKCPSLKSTIASAFAGAVNFV